MRNYSEDRQLSFRGFFRGLKMAIFTGCKRGGKLYENKVDNGSQLLWQFTAKLRVRKHHWG